MTIADVQAGGPSGADGDLGSEIAGVIADSLRDVPDFPIPGVLFKDIAPLLVDPRAFAATVEALAVAARAAGPIDLVTGVEARGFVLAAAVARELNCGLVLVRKAGKLPPPTVRLDYTLEYGTASLEVPAGSLEGRSVFLVDDVLATGGTLDAAVQLLTRAGGHLTGIAVLLEIEALGGRSVLGTNSTTALLRV